MIEGKDAVKIAKAHLLELYADDKLQDVFLEELVLTENKKSWEVIISFLYPRTVTDQGPMSQLVGSTKNYENKLKIFTIDAESGLVISLKNPGNE